MAEVHKMGSKGCKCDDGKEYLQNYCGQTCSCCDKDSPSQGKNKIKKINKSQLKNIIRRSIKELMKESIQQLMNEQTSGCSNIPAPPPITGQSGWYNTSQSEVQACNGMLPGWFQNCPNCVTANTTSLNPPPSNFQNMIQNGFNNQGCQFLVNWQQTGAPNYTRMPQSVGGPNAQAGRLFYPGENPIWQAKKMKKWKFVQDLHGANC
jgi:hypothetical protein